MPTRTPLDSPPGASLGKVPSHPAAGDLQVASASSPLLASTRAGCSAFVREETLIASETVAFHRGTTGKLHRWIRAWMVVAGHYKDESDFAAAKRCDDNAVTLLSFQRAAARAQAVAS